MKRTRHCERTWLAHPPSPIPIRWGIWPNRSRGNDLGEFKEQPIKTLAEELAGASEAAALAEGWVEQFSRFDRQRGGEVVADEAEPVELFSLEAFSTCSGNGEARRRPQG